MREDRVLWLERKTQRWADKYYASVADLRNDDALLIMLLEGNDADAEQHVVYSYAYCEEHDETHGDCSQA